MASLIKPTPILKGRNARNFVKDLTDNKNNLIPKVKLDQDIKLFKSVIKKFNVTTF